MTRILKRLGLDLAAFLFFLALAALATRPLVLHMAGQTLASGDPLVDLWTIDWLVEHFFESSQIFQGNTFLPARHAVIYSDLTLGTVVLLLPFRSFVQDPVPLYNLAVLLTLAFAGWSFHALALELTGNRWAGLLCGTLAAFGSHQMGHLAHINLLAIGWLALFLLGLYRAACRPGVVSAFLAGVSFSLSAQTSGYYAVAGAILALVFAAFRWRLLKERRVLLTLLAAGLLALLLTAPYLRAFHRVRSLEGLRRPLGMSVSMAFRPERDLTGYGYLYRWLLGSGGERLFPGLLTLALAGLAVKRRRPEAGFYLGAAAVLIFVSLGPSLRLGGVSVPLPYRALYALPGLESMRHPYTFAAVATFALSVVAALGWASLRIAARPGAGAAVVLAAVLETLAPGPALQSIPPGLPPHYAVLDRLPPGPILEIPVFSEDSLVWAARHGWPMLNGQGSAFVPIDTLRLDRFIQNHWLGRTPVDVDTSRPTPFLLQKFPVRYVVLPANRTPDLGPLAEAFDRSRVFALVGRSEDGARVYEVKRDVDLTDSGEEREEAGKVVGQDREAVRQEQEPHRHQ